MCIIADPPILVPMFKEDDPEHHKFLPVKTWVLEGPGKFVMGGTQYKTELMKVSKILVFIKELEKRGKIVRKKDEDVDKDVKILKIKEPSKNFDDPHLVALARLSGCKLICLRDPRAHRYLRKPHFYNAAKDRPKLYTRIKNSDLLCKNNIAPCCN